MYQIDFHTPVHVHFIGIGGISMSGLAEILLKEGFTISGSDASRSALTSRLESLGASVAFGQRAENIRSDMDVVVYTAAIHPDNPEYAAARAAGIPMLTRAELLGQIMRNYPTAIAVAGTHGKTTTTSMLSTLLLAAEKDPTITVGGILPEIGGNIRVGHSDLFLTEACEYTNSYLSFYPTVSIILNIEEDHMDFFQDITEIRSSFRRFAGLLPEDGLLVINGEIEHPEEITKDLRARHVTYGLTGTEDYSADRDSITYSETGCASFLLCHQKKPVGPVTLNVPGIHNVSNALAALAAALELGIGFDQAAEGLPVQRAETGRNHCGRLCAPSHRDPGNAHNCRALSPPGALVRLPAAYLYPHTGLPERICPGPFPRGPCGSGRHLCGKGAEYHRHQLRRSLKRTAENRNGLLLPSVF